MEYLTTVKMLKKWNISSRRIITLCIEGRKLNAEFGKGFSDFGRRTPISIIMVVLCEVNACGK